MSSTATTAAIIATNAALMATMNNSNYSGDLTVVEILVIISCFMGTFSFVYILMQLYDINMDCRIIFVMFLLMLIAPLGILTLPLCFIHFLIQKARGY